MMKETVSSEEGVGERGFKSGWDNRRTTKATREGREGMRDSSSFRTTKSDEEVEDGEEVE